MPRTIRLLVLGALLLAVSTPAPSQTPAKRPITHNDYTIWRSVTSPVISPDGAYVAFAVVPQEGDGEFTVRHLDTGKEYRHSRGSRPVVGTGTPPAGGRGGRGGPGAVAAAQHVFTPDGKNVLFPVYGSTDKTKGKGDTRGPGLGIMDLATGKVTRIDRVGRYQVPEEGPSLLVYQRGSGGPTTPGTGAPGGRGGLGKGKGRPTPAPDAKGPAQPVTGSDLFVRNLADGTERTIADVTEYTFSRDGRCLVYVVAGKKEEGNGVYMMDPTGTSPAVGLRNGAGRYSRLSWDEKQQQMVFFHTPPAAKAADGTPTPVAPQLCYWKRPANGVALSAPSPAGGLAGLSLVALQGTPPKPAGAVDLVPAGKAEIKEGWRTTEQGGLSFSRDGSQVYFSVAPPPAPKAPPAADPRDKPAGSKGEKAVVELWHYKDELIQPMQKVRGGLQQRRSHRAVIHMSDRACRQITDETLNDVQPPPTGDWALGTDDRPYRHLIGTQVAGTITDTYLVNLRTGARKPLTKKQAGGLSFSPGGKYLLAFDGKDWHSLSVPDGKRTNLTEKLGVSFANELNDVPNTPGSYGVAGWTPQDKHVLLYDRYDIWMISPDGTSAVNLTKGLGRKTTTQLRLVNLDGRQRTIAPAQPVLVRAESESTRDTGFYRVSLNGSRPLLLIMGARNYGTPVKAKKADRYLLTISSFYDSSDLYVADQDFREVKRLSDANPHKANFVWGKAELIRYKNADGLPLQGVLIKPEDFDPKKRYPMIVYIYERLSQNLHRFVTPQAGTSINPTYYASNGYVVLMPDIAYTVGYPGQSAVKCVLPAVQAVVDQGYVDEKAIGIQGHSWGGYQTSFLITQTTRFKAAAAGAPVANMTSAYGGIRWSTGLPRQFQYEKTQSRIGGSLWQYPTRFLDNSPLFHADRIQTPLLMLHNDRDGAVPWQQGIEYYLALRRLGKEVYLFNYPGEDHGLRQRANQRDYTMRMQQFFDHHLKGAPKPDWMEKGIPYTPPPAGEARPGGRRGAASPPVGAGEE